jgi:hypothetical protein
MLPCVSQNSVFFWHHLDVIRTESFPFYTGRWTKCIQSCFIKYTVHKYNLKFTFFVTMTAFWDMAPRNLMEVDRRFRGAYCLYIRVIMAVRTSDTSVCFYESTRRHIPESCHNQGGDGGSTYL